MLRASFLIGLATLALGGCVERKESILVTPGRVDFHVEHRTKQANDLRDHDAAPDLRGGWLVEEGSDLEHKDDPESDRIYKLTADASFAIQGPLPSNFAEVEGQHADVFLQFPTQVRVEQRSDGVHYHFSRRYEGRRWAEFGVLKAAMDEQLGEFEDKDSSDLTHQNRVTIVRAFVELELHKKLIFARRAFIDLGEKAPQDAWLAARAATLDLRNELDYSRLARMTVDDEDNPDNANALEREAEAFEAGIDSVLEDTLRDTGLPGAMLNQFIDRYRWHARYHQVTEDINDDSFEITIEMPGQIVCSNADHITGGKATWKFSGDALHDRDIELLITSRVSK